MLRGDGNAEVSEKVQGTAQLLTRYSRKGSTIHRSHQPLRSGPARRKEVSAGGASKLEIETRRTHPR